MRLHMANILLHIQLIVLNFNIGTKISMIANSSPPVLLLPSWWTLFSLFNSECKIQLSKDDCISTLSWLNNYMSHGYYGYVQAHTHIYSFLFWGVAYGDQ